MAEHEATPELWALLQRQSQTLGSAESMALLELRARVEALEAAQPERITQEDLAKLLAQPAPVVPLATASAGSLVERVGTAIDNTEYDEEGRRWAEDEARAAIREVAAWLEDENTDIGMGTAGNIAERLRDEAER
jgi:hypothetical protein